MSITSHRHHDSHYLVLFLLIATGFFAFTNFNGIPHKQFQIGAVTALAYGWWGIFHHYFEQDLHWKVVVEYVSITVFGIGILWFLLASIN